MAEPPHDYHIDYDAPDVLDIMRQVREHAVQDAGEPWTPPAGEAAGARLHEYLLLNDARCREIQRALGLGGDWNVSPEDLRASHPGTAGALISGLRRLLRPITKAFANLELPLYKQFKANLGIAAALHDLLRDNARLRQRLDDVHRRVERLEGEETGRRDR